MICFSVVRCTFVLLNMLINTLLQSVLPVITFMVIEVDFFKFFFYYRSSRINTPSKLSDRYQALIK